MSAPLQSMIPKGSTGQSVYLRVQNQISFVPQTSFMPSVAGLVVKYHRMGDPTQTDGGVSIALTSIANLSVAHTPGGLIPIWDGFVRFDIPDAACAKTPNVNKVLVTLAATGVFSYGCLIQLTDADPVVGNRTPVY